MTKTRGATLALGGGGARGVAHLGVIESLLDAGHAVNRIVGVSIGSLAGAMYAFDPDIERVQKRALDYLLSPEFEQHQHELFGAHPQPGEETTGGVFSWYHRVTDYLRARRMLYRVVRTPSLLPGILLQEVVDYLLPDADIADAAVPLSIVAVDLHSGRRVVLDEGPLRLAVRASSSLPGIFPPVEYDGMLLCDIGVFCSLPLAAARSYDPETLVAVDVGSGLKPLSAPCATALDVLMRMDEIGEAMFRQHLGGQADLLIRPEVSGVEWFDFSLAAELVEAGRVAGRQALQELPADRGNGAKKAAFPLRWLGALRPMTAMLRSSLGL